MREPPERESGERKRPVIESVGPFIDEILQGDRQAPRKQRHTAHRIWHVCARSGPTARWRKRTVREYVHDRKLALGLLAREVCVAQSYDWGVEAQVDWYEAYADLGGERTKLYVFALRSMASGAAFHCAFSNATQQAFLEAHELAFAWFGGVFHGYVTTISAAVKKILRGQQREETSRFIAFRSHWRFPASSARRRKVTRKVESKPRQAISGATTGCRCRKPRDLADLNRLLAACRQDEQRIISGRSQTVGAAQLVERPHLLPLASRAWTWRSRAFPRSMVWAVQVRTNFYSVPAAAGTRSTPRPMPAGWSCGTRGTAWLTMRAVTGTSSRFWSSSITSMCCGGSLGLWPDPRRLTSRRQAGLWPVSFDRIWEALMARQGKQNGTRQMFGLLKLGPAVWPRQAAGGGGSRPALGCSDAAAVEHLLASRGPGQRASELVELGHWNASTAAAGDDRIRSVAQPGGAR